MRCSLTLIHVSLHSHGGLIRMSCVVFNARLTITMRRLPFRSKSYLDFEREKSNADSDAQAGLPPPINALLTELVLPPGWTSH